MPLVYKIQFRIEKMVPPMTGAGMQYFRSSLIFVFRKPPRKKTATAAARVWYMFKLISIVNLPFFNYRLKYKGTGPWGQEIWGIRMEGTVFVMHGNGRPCLL